jgi:hypothetical protein
MDTLTHVRTTLLIDDALVREAKKRALEKGQTLSELVTDALRLALHAPRPEAPARFSMPTFGGEEVLHHEPAAFATAVEEDDRRQRRR